MSKTDRELLERAIVVLEMTVDTRRCSITVQRTMNAIRARLAEPEVKRVPMDRAEVDAMLDKLPKGAVCLDIVRAVEAHHGIE